MEQTCIRIACSFDFQGSGWSLDEDRLIGMAMANSAGTDVFLTPGGFSSDLWALVNRHQVSHPWERLWSSGGMLMVSGQLEKLEDCSCQQHSRCWCDKGSDL